MTKCKVDLVNEILTRSFKRNLPDQNSICHTRSDYEEYEGNKLFALLKDKELNFFTHNDCEEIRVNSEKFKRNSFFSFLKTEGLIYYLPAFLTYVSKHKDFEFMGHLFFRLMPGDTDLSMNLFGDLFDMLSIDEIEAIKKVLPIINDIWIAYGVRDNGAKKALDSYWLFV